MANYYKFENLPDVDRIEYDHGRPAQLLDIFKSMLTERSGSGYYYGSSTSMAMIWNALCTVDNFPDEESFKATVLPIAQMIIERASEIQNYSVCSPSFQLQVARLLKRYYPDVKGRKIKE